MMQTSADNGAVVRVQRRARKAAAERVRGWPKVTTPFPPERLVELEGIATRECRSVSALVRELVGSGLAVRRAQGTQQTQEQAAAV